MTVMKLHAVASKQAISQSDRMIGTEYKRYMKNGLLCNKEYDEVL
jgi:hypothetical protein